MSDERQLERYLPRQVKWCFVGGIDLDSIEVRQFPRTFEDDRSRNRLAIRQLACRIAGLPGRRRTRLTLRLSLHLCHSNRVRYPTNGTRLSDTKQ